MPKIIVSDTSCLILFQKINKLSLLSLLFGKITITEIVAEEYGEKLPEFIDIENPNNQNYQKILETYLDPGEASSIALAIEKEDCLLIMDDYKARKEAKQLKIDFTGSLGILIVAKERGLIQEVNAVLKEIEGTDFRISEKLKGEVRKMCGE